MLMGGMTKAVDSGWAKLKIEASAAEKQARIDSGKDVIVGVNKYKLKTQDAVDIREVDNVARCARGRSRGWRKVRATRDSAKVQAALAALTDCARIPAEGNLLAPEHHCDAQARATVGDISDALGSRLRAPPRRHPKGDSACTQPPMTVPRAGTS